MTRRALAVLLALLALAPQARAAPDPEFPDALTALLPGWAADAEALAAPHAGKAWYPEAKAFLDSARTAQAEGRLRSALFDLETHAELVTAGALLDEAAGLGSDAERKSLVLQRTAQWHGEARQAWQAYRDRLLEAQDEVKSLRGMEVALYSADQALAARLLTDEREAVAREFPKQPGVDRGYVLALVRSSRTAVLAMGWAEDMLGAVSAYEGLPPRLNETAWNEAATFSLAPFQGQPPQHLVALEAVMDEARPRNESVLAVAVNLAEQRAGRATSIYVIYGDATSRGKNVTGDATRAMARQLDNTTMDEARARGLLGVFTADAIDRARKTHGYAEQGLVDLGIVIAAWASLDHQKYVTATLGAASPVAPTPPGDPAGHETPLGVPVALAALAAAALALGARRKG